MSLGQTLQITCCFSAMSLGQTLQTTCCFSAMSLGQTLCLLLLMRMLTLCMCSFYLKHKRSYVIHFLRCFQVSWILEDKERDHLKFGSNSSIISNAIVKIYNGQHSLTTPKDGSLKVEKTENIPGILPVKPSDHYAVPE